MKRMSTWDRAHLSMRTHLLYYFTHHVIFMIKMNKDVCVYMQIRCEK